MAKSVCVGEDLVRIYAFVLNSHFTDESWRIGLHDKVPRIHLGLSICVHGKIFPLEITSKSRISNCHHFASSSDYEDTADYKDLAGFFSVVL